MAARLGKEEAARLVLHWVVGGDLVGRLYLDEVSNLDERVARLSDSKLHIWCINSLMNKCRPYIKFPEAYNPSKW